MTLRRCNVCEFELTTPVYSSKSKNSITSLCSVVEGGTVVYLCYRCNHLQTNEVKNIDQYYDKDYKLLVDSDEEDQIYCIRGGDKVFRYDHQVNTLIKLLDIGEGANVLDYGCAKGTTLKKLVKQRTDITPYLFDVSDMYLSFWKKFVKEGHWGTYSADPHWTGTMDVVTSFFSLEHVASPRSMLSNIWGLLKRNGIFYCIVPDILQNIADFVVIDHVNHFTNSSISYLFSESGFEVLEINTSDHASAMIVIARKCEEVGRLHEVQLSDTERCTITSEVANMENYWSKLSLRIQNFERGLKEFDRFAIYGSGFYGTYIASCLIDQDRFKYFLDRDPYRQKKRLLGKRIIDPELMPEQINTVMVGLNPSVARKNIEMITSWNARDINFFYL